MKINYNLSKKTNILKTISFSLFIFITSCHAKQEIRESDLDKSKISTNKDQEIKPEAVYAIKVKQEISTIKVTASGTVQPSEQGIANVVSPINGLIEKMSVHIGSKVTKSSVLLTLKSVDVNDVKSGYLATVSDTKSGLSATRGQMEEAKRLANLNKELFAVGAISKNDLIASLNSVKQLDITLKGYEEKLKMHQSNEVHDFVLKSPIDGTIYEINTHNGDRVQNDPTNPLIRIVNDKMLVVANVYDKDMKAFTIDKKVNITSDSNPELNIEGTIKYISDVIDPDTKTLKVFITPSSSKGLKLNMFVKVSLTEQKGFTFKIPKKTIVFKENNLYVFKKENDKYSLFPIKLIDDSNQEFALVKGLKANDEIASEAMLLEKD
ncbi:MAG: efflux RND transporter periplasmic adaptor subunit [Candidatus Sericytochromatia bacterium]|nr:efflux RND transporter periplasmic adaptor subunit [Candidatus Sericytochromatia bacterium]